MLKLDGLREFSKGLSTAASKALMKSTPLRSLEGFHIWLQKSSLKPGKRLTNNDGVKKGFLRRDQLTYFPQILD